MSSGKILGIIAIGFVVGVFAESFLRFGFAFGVFFLLVSGALFLIEKLDFSRGNLSGKIQFILPLFLLAVSLGVFRMAMTAPKNFPFYNLLGQTVSMEGLIYEEPDTRENYVNLKVKVQNNEKSERLLVRTELFPKFNYGDKVKISGVISKPEKFENENGGHFDYPSYLAKDGIYYIIDKAKVSLVSSGEGYWLKSALYGLKGKFIETVGQLIPEPESSFLSGLLVGGKQSMGKEWLERFQKAGVMHVVVLSGYNITIVAESVIKFFSVFLSQVLAMVFGAVSIILFAIMTGGSATVVRASIMALIVILARAAKRRYVVSRALIIAGVLMVIQNPAIVAFDPSFQLSFLATIALIYVSPIVEPYLKFLPEKLKIKEIAVSTIATQIFVLPMLLFMTGQFSVIGFLVNLLVLALIPMTMLFGFLSGIIGFISLTLALPFAYGAFGLLFYELGVIKTFSALPFASVALPALPGFFVILIYLVAAFAISEYFRRKGSASNS